MGSRSGIADGRIGGKSIQEVRLAVSEEASYGRRLYGRRPVDVRTVPGNFTDARLAAIPLPDGWNNHGHIFASCELALPQKHRRTIRQRISHPSPRFADGPLVIRSQTTISAGRAGCDA